MSRLASITIALVLATGCGSSGPSVDHATMGTLQYTIPSGWQSRDLGDIYTRRVEWTPPDNTTAKESVVIMHSSAREAHLKAGSGHIEKLLERAQNNLPKGIFTKPSRFVTKYGFEGVRIEGSFVPPGKSEPYQRIHAVLLDTNLQSFIHVLYTAKIADRESFEVVIDSLSKRGA
jgi:hypothetical protein